MWFLVYVDMGLISSNGVTGTASGDASNTSQAAQTQGGLQVRSQLPFMHAWTGTHMSAGFSPPGPWLAWMEGGGAGAARCLKSYRGPDHAAISCRRPLGLATRSSASCRPCSWWASCSPASPLPSCATMSTPSASSVREHASPPATASSHVPACVQVSRVMSFARLHAQPTSSRHGCSAAICGGPTLSRVLQGGCFSHDVTHMHTGVGLGMWVLGAIFTGVSRSYGFLLFARIFMGAGACRPPSSHATSPSSAALLATRSSCSLQGHGSIKCHVKNHALPVKLETACMHACMQARRRS